jgi:hypothetical protein
MSSTTPTPLPQRSRSHLEVKDERSLLYGIFCVSSDLSQRFYFMPVVYNTHVDFIDFFRNLFDVIEYKIVLTFAKQLLYKVS